jgi:hypothetical protein
MEMRPKLLHSIRMEAERSSPHQIITATKAKFVGIFRNNKNKTQIHFSRRRVDGIFFVFFSLEIIIFLGFNEKYWPLWLLERNHNNNKKNNAPPGAGPGSGKKLVSHHQWR